jgi:hypothetical protein
MLTATLRKHCNALGYEVSLNSLDSGHVACRFGDPSVLHILDQRYVSCRSCPLAMLTISLGFKDPLRLKYATQDCAVFALTFFTGHLLLYNLFSLHSKV